MLDRAWRFDGRAWRHNCPGPYEPRAYFGYLTKRGSDMEALIKLALEGLALAIKQLKALGVSDEEIGKRSKEFCARADKQLAADRAGDLAAMGASPAGSGE